MPETLHLPAACVRSAIGFDADSEAIRSAIQAAQRLGCASVRFEQRRVAEPWPVGRFDVVSLIDVMHHVPVLEQQMLIEAALEHVEPGGLLLYKDMVSRPLWRAAANRLHDLVLARQWIHYLPLDSVIQWSTRMGASLACRRSMDMFWYGHEWCVLRK